jgi:N-acetylmuramoyl-L-alanine amidase
MKPALIRIFLAAALLQPAAWGEDGFRTTWVNQKDYVSLKELARVYGARIEGPNNRVVSVANKWNRVEFTVNGREVRINGSLVWMHEPLQAARGRWVIRGADARKVLDPILRPHLHLQPSGYRVVVLDPGHGGQDTGARGRRGTQEKKVVLDIARRVRAQLVNAGYRVYMTRDTDRFVELDDRTRKTRSWGADLFVSIHLNSAVSAEPSGVETYVLAAADMYSTAGGTLSGAQSGNRHDAASSVLGYRIQRALSTHIGAADRGVKRSRFLVLKDAPCAAALVECGFVSNRAEEEKLLRDDFRQAVSDGIAQGLLSYLGDVKRARLTP